VDDTQVYISAPVVESQQAAIRLAKCIERLDCWMGQNSLKLNAEKTQLMWLGSRHQLAKLTVSQLSLATTTSSSTVDIVSTANDIDVILGSQLPMATHISSVCRAGFFPATSAAVRLPISDDRGDTRLSPGLHQLSSQLLQLSSAGVADVYLRRLQSVQNAAARLVSGARCHDHITPVLVSLHWLPVRQRIIYKTAMLVWKCRA